MNTTAAPFCKEYLGTGQTMNMQGFAVAIGDIWCINLFFPTWTINSAGRYAGALIVCFILGFLVEAFAHFRKCFHKRFLTVSGRSKRRGAGGDCSMFGEPMTPASVSNATAGGTATGFSHVVLSDENENCCPCSPPTPAVAPAQTTTTADKNNNSNATIPLLQQQGKSPEEEAGIPEWLHYVPSFFYGIQMLIAYLAMLVVMLYETIMFITLIVGLVVGHMIFTVYMGRKEKVEKQQAKKRAAAEAKRVEEEEKEVLLSAEQQKRGSKISSNSEEKYDLYLSNPPTNKKKGEVEKLRITTSSSSPVAAGSNSSKPTHPHDSDDDDDAAVTAHTPCCGGSSRH